MQPRPPHVRLAWRELRDGLLVPPAVLRFWPISDEEERASAHNGPGLAKARQAQATVSTSSGTGSLALLADVPLRLGSY